MQRNFTKGCVQRCLMAVPLLLLLSFSYAQKSAQPGRNVTLNNSNISLREVFNIIEKQTGVVLFFMDINTNQQVGIHVANTPVEDVLAEVLNPLGLTYEYVKGNRDKIFIKSVGGTRVVKKDTAQVVVVSGVVMDERGEPLPGASVRIKGTQYGTATKPNGSFTLMKAGLDDVLQVSYTGFIMQEVVLNGRINVNVKLKVGDNSLNETVVVAYGTSSQKNFTGALTVVKGMDVQNLPYRSFDKSLQGMVPGLLVTGGTGQPGSGVSNMVIRGISTGAEAFFGSTVRNPLIVIDGIPVTQDRFQINSDQSSTSISNPLAQINPSDIETITVLKDAVAIALYGSKASNGVILVTTKKGKVGKSIISIRHQTDFGTRLKGKVELLDKQEYLDLVYETYRNTNSMVWTDQAIRKDLFNKFPYTVSPAGDSSFFEQPNWSKEIFKNNAITVSNELSLSGGNDKNLYYLGLEYTKQDGIVKNTGYDRKSLRLNLENRSAEWLKIGINTMLSYSVQNYTNPFENVYSNGFSLVAPPLIPVRSTDGSYLLNFSFPFRMANPAAELEYNTNRNVSYRGLSKLYASVNFLRHFTFTTNLGFDFMLAEIKEKFDPRLFDPISFSTGGRISERDIRRSSLISTNTIGFSKEFTKKHSFNLLLGQEAQVASDKNLSGEVRGSTLSLPLSNYDEISSPGYKVSDLGGYRNKQTLLSVFGQLNYGFKERYLVTSSIRGDGSSRFGNRKQWGTFWSTGIGWIVSEESFLKRLKSTISYLKLRASVGIAGSSAAVDASTRYSLLYNTMFNNNNALVPESQPGNPDIRWEKTTTWDAGLEAKVLNDRALISLDLYNRKTADLIYTTNLSSVTGYPSVLKNIGDMRNKGVEISLSLDLIKGTNFEWNCSFNWSTNKNILVKANVPLAAISGDLLANEEGRNFNSFYLRRWAGVNPSDGNPLWLDSLGKPTSNYYASKREFVGKPQPDGFGAITQKIRYKGVELSLMLSYKYGFEIYSNDLLVNDGLYPYTNQDKRAMDRWQKAGDIAKNPKRVLNNYPALNKSTRHLYKGDNIRLQNIYLCYNFPKHVLNNVGMSMLRVYVQAQNVALLTKYPGQDVDNMNVGGSIRLPYPNQRTISVGLNCSL